jgi:hypothetical protein
LDPETFVSLLLLEHALATSSEDKPLKRSK